MASKLAFIVGAARQTANKRRVLRNTVAVMNEYGASWESFRETLSSAETLEAWLNIDGLDRRNDWFNIDGELIYGRHNASAFYRAQLKRAIDTHFPKIASITEYGCGIGRNLLFLKSLFPGIRCYGYELVPAGVDIAQRAAQKFGLEVEYAQLDYVQDPVAKFVFPPSDIAFTMFSLEQLPDYCDRALHNIISHVRFGTIHIEPVPENYPLTVRGLIGRLDHKKAGYLQGFPKAVCQQPLKSITHERLATAHNPLMFPSLYVTKK